MFFLPYNWLVCWAKREHGDCEWRQLHGAQPESDGGHNNRMFTASRNTARDDHKQAETVSAKSKGNASSPRCVRHSYTQTLWRQKGGFKRQLTCDLLEEITGKHKKMAKPSLCYGQLQKKQTWRRFWLPALQDGRRVTRLLFVPAVCRSCTRVQHLHDPLCLLLQDADMSSVFIGLTEEVLIALNYVFFNLHKDRALLVRAQRSNWILKTKMLNVMCCMLRVQRFPKEQTSTAKNRK